MELLLIIQCWTPNCYVLFFKRHNIPGGFLGLVVFLAVYFWKFDKKLQNVTPAGPALCIPKKFKKKTFGGYVVGTFLVQRRETAVFDQSYVLLCNSLILMHWQLVQRMSAMLPFRVLKTELAPCKILYIFHQIPIQHPHFGLNRHQHTHLNVLTDFFASFDFSSRYSRIRPSLIVE